MSRTIRSIQTVFILLFSFSAYGTTWEELKGTFQKGPNEEGFETKLSLIDHVIRNPKTSFNGKVYIVYFNAAVAGMGYSHAVIWANGYAYEISNHADESGHKIWKRELSESLKIKTPVPRLPTSILEVPVSELEQKDIVEFIEKERRNGAIYRFHNQMGTYNCMGIIYAALKNAGFSLPYLKGYQFLPIQLMKMVKKVIPSTKIIGDVKGFIAAGEIPNHRLIQGPLSLSRNACSNLIPGITSYFLIL